MTTAVSVRHTSTARRRCAETSTSVNESFSRQGNSRGGEIEPPSIRNGQLQARRRFMVFA